MAIRYRTRTRRLERTTSRIESARRAIAGHERMRAEREAWWRTHVATLTAWRREIERRQLREPSGAAADAATRFRRWARALRRLHPAVLRLRAECWWLSVRLGLRTLGRGR
jgi:hypothetical protein